MTHANKYAPAALTDDQLGRALRDRATLLREKADELEAQARFFLGEEPPSRNGPAATPTEGVLWEALPQSRLGKTLRVLAHASQPLGMEELLTQATRRYPTLNKASFKYALWSAQGQRCVKRLGKGRATQYTLHVPGIQKAFPQAKAT